MKAQYHEVNCWRCILVQTSTVHFSSHRGGGGGRCLSTWVIGWLWVPFGGAPWMSCEHKYETVLLYREHDFTPQSNRMSFVYSQCHLILVWGSFRFWYRIRSIRSRILLIDELSALTDTVRLVITCLFCSASQPTVQKNARPTNSTYTRRSWNRALPWYQDPKLQHQ
jgi:hypothetical protein